MKLFYSISVSVLGLFVISCAPTIHIVDRYPSEQKKTIEWVKGKGSSGRIIKRIEYYPNGAKKSESKIKNGRPNGPFIGFYKNGSISVKGQSKNGLLKACHMYEATCSGSELPERAWQC